MAAYGDTGKGSGYNSYARVSSIIRKATQDENPYLQFVSTEEVLGGSKKGDTISITRKYDTTGGFPKSPLAEKSKIPVTDYVQDSVTLTLKEWGNRIDITEKLIKLSDFNEADKAAEALRDEWLFVPEDATAELPADTYWIHEIVGLHVKTEDGVLLGAITEVLPTGANDVYEVQPAEGGPFLIPAIAEVVRSVDLLTGVMVVRLPEGLLDSAPADE